MVANRRFAAAPDTTFPPEAARGVQEVVSGHTPERVVCSWSAPLPGIEYTESFRH